MGAPDVSCKGFVNRTFLACPPPGGWGHFRARHRVGDLGHLVSDQKPALQDALTRVIDSAAFQDTM